MLNWIQTALNTYFLHSEHGNGYQFWSSGPGPGLGQITILAAIVGVAKHRNCHHPGCWRTWPFAHRHPKHGWPSCKHHWNETPAHIVEARREDGTAIGHTTSTDW